METKFNLQSGKMYKVFNSKFTNDSGMIHCNSVHQFVKSFYCYDARFHGIANPNDFICYEFKLPKKFGVVRFYQYQINSIKEISINDLQ